MSVCGKSGLKCARIYTEGDTGPGLVLKLTDQAGAKDLTGYSFTLYLNRNGLGTDVISKTGVVNDVTSGQVLFNWVAGDLISSAEEQEVHIEINNGSTISSLPRFCIKVLEKVTP